MRFLSLVIFFIACCGAAHAQSGMVPRLSPQTKIFLSRKAEKGIVPGYVYNLVNGRSYISALIKVAPGFSAKALTAKEVHVGTRAGDIWTAQVPVDRLADFVTTPGIAYIQLDEPVRMDMDSARKRSYIDSAHQGLGLSAPLLGNGVVVGIVDAGFDFTSPNLWDTGGSYYRVKRIWEQKSTAGVPPSGFLYGTELSDSASMVNAGTDQPGQSHGAHVAGIAGGSGYLIPRFRGVAPLSDLVLVGIMPPQNQWISTGGTDIIDGISYVFQYAGSVNKPAVVNLSWGANKGPHDGTSLFSQALDNLTGPGRIYVTSAGNSGATKLHLSKSFTAGDTLLHTFPAINPAVKKTWVDMWGDTGKTFCVQATLYNGSTAIGSTGFVCMDDALHQFALIGSNNDTCFVDIVASDTEFNMQSRAFVNIYSKVADSLCISVKSTDGIVHLWNGYVEAPTGYDEPFTNGGKPWATAGNTDITISDNASSESAITVGAYATKQGWKNASNVSYNYNSGTPVGAIASFSSRGPATDGRMKPDITGPGYGVVSSVSSYDPAFLPGGPSYAPLVVSNVPFPLTGKTYPYAILSGTSMSSPVVSGVIALMLQVDKNLDPAGVKAILTATARKDNYTGAAMDNTWGAGKVNAYQALKYTLQHTGIGGIAKNDLACHLFPNPAHNSFSIGYLGERPEALTIAVYDAAGRRVHSDSWTTSGGYCTRSLNVSGLPAGLYIVKVSKGTQSSSQRLLLQ